MGLFGSKPTSKDARAFARGKRTSAKAAELYAQQRRDARATRNAVAARKRAQQKAAQARKNRSK